MIWGNLFQSSSVPNGLEAKFLSEVGFKTALNSCVSKQKGQAHPEMLQLVKHLNAVEDFMAEDSVCPV